MTTLDDITADVNSKITTQTTGDNTSLRVRTALINLATQILDDVAAQNTTITTGIASATAAATAASVLAAAEGRASDTAFVDLLGSAGIRSGQAVFGLQNIRPHPPIGGGVQDAQLNGDGTAQATGSVTDWMVSGFIAVVPGQVYTVGIATGTGLAPGVNVGFTYYKSDKTYQGGGAYPSGTWTNGATFTVPSDAFFIRFAVDCKNAHRIMLYQGTVATTDVRHKWYGLASTVHMHRPWTDRTWIFAGDSMGATRSGNSWVSDVAKYHGCRMLNNQAVDGGTTVTLMKKWNRPTDFTRVDYTSGDLTAAHAVITQVGINDFTVGTAVGAITDATTATTFFGQYKKFIEMVLTLNPYLKLILGTPTGDNTSLTSRSNILPYRQAVRDLCDYYALNCWDVGRTSQNSPFTQASYTVDGLHADYAASSPRRWTDGNPAHEAVPRNYGSKIMWGSNLAAFMHTVFPADWSGDPFIDEDDFFFVPQQI